MQYNPTLLLWSKLRKCCFLSLPSNASHCRTATPRACLDSLGEIGWVLPFSPLLCFSLALWSGSTTCSVAQRGDGAASHTSRPHWLFLTSKTHPHGSTQAPQKEQLSVSRRAWRKKLKSRFLPLFGCGVLTAKGLVGTSAAQAVGATLLYKYVLCINMHLNPCLDSNLSVHPAVESPLQTAGSFVTD